jgi:hypothetical protein
MGLMPLLIFPGQNWTTSMMRFGLTFPRKECDHEMKTVLSGTHFLKFQASRAPQGNERHRALVGHFGQTFYRWKKQYAGMLVEGVRELKILREKNARLKKLVAELNLAKAVQIDFSQPRKPTDNCFIWTFNGSLRDECLKVHWFASLAEVRTVFEP